MPRTKGALCFTNIASMEFYEFRTRLKRDPLLWKFAALEVCCRTKRLAFFFPCLSSAYLRLNLVLPELGLNSFCLRLFIAFYFNVHLESINWKQRFFYIANFNQLFWDSVSYVQITTIETHKHLQLKKTRQYKNID